MASATTSRDRAPVRERVERRDDDVAPQHFVERTELRTRVAVVAGVPEDDAAAPESAQCGRRVFGGEAERKAAPTPLTGRRLLV